MHFLIRAKAAAVWPGGFGTLDEMSELLTLVQTERMEPLPIVLFGKEFWGNVLNFDYMIESGVISEEDLDLFLITDEPKEAVEYIKNFYE
jgi:predicted Rossmann-fold nucleotide-binding protein